MTAHTSTIEDLESNKDQEFERIKQNFTTPPAPNIVETQTAFQVLQSELRDFLTQHIDKVSLIQEHVVGRVTSTVSNGINVQRTIVPVATPRMSRLSSADSNQATEEERLDTPTKPIINTADKAFVDTHMRNLQVFLTKHLENVRLLQESCGSPPPPILHEVPPTTDNAPASIRNDAIDKSLDIAKTVGLNLAISIFTAVFIVVFLLLTVAIIGTRHRTPYSVAMFFSFLALASLFLAIVIATLALRTSAHENPNLEEIKFYLQICEQLRLIAIGLTTISIIIAMFLGIFVSLAFPFVVVVISGAGALSVFASVHWEVAITFKNILYLLKNIRRVGMVVDFVKYNRKVPAYLRS